MDQLMEQQNSMQPAAQQMHPHLPSTIFFAGVNPLAQPEALLRTFAQFGRVLDLNLFRPYKGSRISKVCGAELTAFMSGQHSPCSLHTSCARS